MRANLRFVTDKPVDPKPDTSISYDVNSKPKTFRLAPVSVETFEIRHMPRCTQGHGRSLPGLFLAGRIGGLAGRYDRRRVDFPLAIDFAQPVRQ